MNFEITNITSGTVLGTYAADSESAALDVMARDAGYSDFAESCVVTGSDGSDLLVRKLPSIDLVDLLRLETGAAR